MSDNYPITPSFRSLLVDYAVEYFTKKPEDILQFSVYYFLDLKRKLRFGQDSVQTSVPKRSKIKLKVVDHNKERSDSTKDKYGRRGNVCSESIKPESMSTLKVQIIKKTPEQINKLRRSLEGLVFFQSLDSNDIDQIINAMSYKKVKRGTQLIHQGEVGDYFFVVDHGKFQAIVKGDDEKERVVASYENKGSFGELALLHNTPRAATVIAVTDGAVFFMERHIFRKIVALNAHKNRIQLEELISEVPVLKELCGEERLKIAEALKMKNYKNNECIFKEGDAPDGMYFIISGDVRITLTINFKEVELKRLGQGDYFGELALLNNRTRAASAYAVGKLAVAFLDTETFERLLGPCIDIMKRNIDAYEQRMKEVSDLQIDLLN